MSSASEPLPAFPEATSHFVFPAATIRQLIFWLLALHLILIAATPPDLDMDLGWQIAQGRWMVHHAAFYLTDELNFANAHQPVIDEYPLFQLLCYGADCCQPYGLVLLRIILCLALFVPLIYLEKRLTPRGGDFLFPLALVVAASFIEFSLRAQLFSLFFTSVFVIALTKMGETPDWKRAWPLCVIQICWVNIHSGFILGPLLAVSIGFQVILSQLFRGIVNRQSIYSWCLLWLALSFSCLVNPYGTERLSLPFYQDNLNLIRIYVAEMHPLSGPALTWGYTCAVTGLVLVLIARFIFELRLPFGVIAMALILFNSALSTAKYWSFFVYFIPLIILASEYISKDVRPAKTDSEPPFHVLGSVVLMVLSVWMGYSCLKGIPDLFHAWADYKDNHTLQPTAATTWIQAHHLKGNFINRAEIGGWLQEHFESGNDKTFCDGGLGKFTATFIQEIALLGDRPNLLPIFLQHIHNPDIIAITSLQSCYWPSQLRRIHYKLVFYSPNSSVWLPLQQDGQPVLPEVTPSSVWARYQQDQEWLEKGDPLTLLRSLVTLHGSGCPAEAAAIWQRQPAPSHVTDDYWTAVRFLCQDGSPTNPLWDDQTASFFYPEAEQQQSQPKPNQDSAERTNFMALAKFYEDKDQDALTVLHQALISGVPDNSNLALLRLKILTRAGKWKEALDLARDRNLFDPLSGEYWGLLAICLEHSREDSSAAEAWQKAVDLAPDAPGVLSGAGAYAKRTHNPQLAESVARWISN